MPLKRKPLGKIPKETDADLEEQAVVTESQKKQAQAFVKRLRKPARFVSGGKVRKVRASVIKRLWEAVTG